MSPDQSVLRPLSFSPAGSQLSQLESERANAKTRGYAEGYAAAVVAATKEARIQREEIAEAADAAARTHRQQQQQAVSALEAAADALISRTVPAIESVDRSLVEASLQLAEAILGHELLDGEHSAAAALCRVVGAVDVEELRTVRMHPQTVASLPQGAADEAGVSIQPDTSLAPGDAVAELPEGFIDARISATLARCRQLLSEGGPR